MRKPQDDPTALRAAAADLVYEAKRLFGAWKLYPDIAIRSGTRSAESDIAEELRLLVFEALLLHLRVLLDFFFPRGTVRDSDVIMLDFLPDPPPDLKTLPAWVDGYRLRLDRLLSHLTYKRLDYRKGQQMDWADLPERLNDMAAFVGAFIDALDSERRRWFESQK